MFLTMLRWPWLFLSCVWLWRCNAAGENLLPAPATERSFVGEQLQVPAHILRSWYAASNATVAWSLGDLYSGAADVSNNAAHPTTTGGEPLDALAEATDNEALCGRADNRSAGNACAMSYQWPREQLRRASTIGALYGTSLPIHTGAMLQSRSPLGLVCSRDAEGDGPGCGAGVTDLGHQLNGASGFVLSVWWRGPAQRTGSFGLLGITSPMRMFHPIAGGPGNVRTCPLGFFEVGLNEGQGVFFGAQGNGTYYIGHYALIGLQQAQSMQQSYLGSWHNLLLVVNPRSRLNGAMVAMANGASGPLLCSEAIGIPQQWREERLAPQEMPLPDMVSQGCTFQLAPPRTFIASRDHFSYDLATVFLGTDAFFDFPGTPTDDSGGATASMAFHFTDAPVALANRMALSHSSPDVALMDMATVAGGRIVCSSSALAPPFAGRVMCRAQCAATAEVPLMRLSRVCGQAEPAGGGLWSVVDRSRWLCNGSASEASAGAGASPSLLDRVSRVAMGGVPGAGWLLPVPVTYPSPAGWSGVLGAVGPLGVAASAGPSNTTMSSHAGLEEWARAVPWSRVRQPPTYNSSAASAPTTSTPTSGVAVECGRPGSRLELGHRTGQSMVVQMCLGGLSVDPRFNDTARLLVSPPQLQQLLLTIQSELQQLLGLGEEETWRVIVDKAGAMLPGDAARMLAYAGVEGGSAAEMCANPARSRFEATVGAGFVSSDCLCVHAVVLDGAGRASRVSESAWYLASTLASGLRYAPSLSTQLLHVSSVSSGSVHLLPVHECVTAPGMGALGDVWGSAFGFESSLEELLSSAGVRSGAPSLGECPAGSWSLWAHAGVCGAGLLVYLAVCSCMWALWRRVHGGWGLGTGWREASMIGMLVSSRDPFRGRDSASLPRARFALGAVDSGAFEEAMLSDGDGRFGGSQVGGSVACCAVACLPLQACCPCCMHYGECRPCRVCRGGPMTDDGGGVVVRHGGQAGGGGLGAAASRRAETGAMVDDARGAEPALRDELSSIDDAAAVEVIRAVLPTNHVWSLDTDDGDGASVEEHGAAVDGRGPEGIAVANEGPLAASSLQLQAASRRNRTGLTALLATLADTTVWVSSSAVLAGMCMSTGAVASLGAPIALQLGLGACVAGPIVMRVLLLSCGLWEEASCGGWCGRCARMRMAGSDPGDETGEGRGRRQASCCSVTRWCWCCCVWCRTRLSDGEAVLGSAMDPAGGQLGWRFAKARGRQSSAFSVTMLLSALDLSCLRGLLPVLSRELGTDWSLVGDAAGRMRRGVSAVEAVVAVPWLVVFASLLVWAGLSLNARACLLLPESDWVSVAAWGGSGCSGSELCEAAGCLLTGTGWERGGSAVLLGVLWACAGVWLRIAALA